MVQPASRDRRTDRIRLARGRAVVEIAPGVGGRIAALVVDGWDLVRRDGWTDNEWGIFVMAPWVGRLRNARVAWNGRAWEVPATEPPHALHGLLAAVPWAVVATTRHGVRLQASLGDAWPTGGNLVHSVELLPDRLVLRLEVHADRGPTPAIVGWHPWFRRTLVRAADWESQDGAGMPDAGVAPGSVEIDIQALRRVALDRDGLPTGALAEPLSAPVDDVLLGVTDPPEVRWPGGPTLRLEASGEAVWIAYTAHPDGVCVEPVTGLPDGINGGLLGDTPAAVPGNPLEATFEIAWR